MPKMNYNKTLKKQKGMVWVQTPILTKKKVFVSVAPVRTNL